MKKFYLFMLMAVGLLISGNLRADNVCKIVGGQEYATVQEAINAAESGQTVQLLTDIDHGSVTTFPIYTISSEKNITLDLNNCKVTALYEGTSSCELVKLEGKLTIQDNSSSKNGMLEMVTNQSVGFGPGRYTIEVEGNGELTLNSGTIIRDPKNGEGASYAINQTGNSKIFVNGGLIKNTYKTTIRINNPSANGTCYFNMTDGAIEGMYGIWGWLSSSTAGNVNINISGGRISSTKPTEKWTIELESEGVDMSKFTLTVTGGVFDGYFDLGASDAPNTTPGAENISINGGDFRTHNVVRPNRGQTKFIQGGTYFFTTGTTKSAVHALPVYFTSDAEGNLCQSYSQFSKWRGDLGTIDGWEALGYIVEQTTLRQQGINEDDGGRTWYMIYKETKSTEDYKNFLTLIAEGYMAVDITGTSEGRTEGTWPDKTVIVKQVNDVHMSGTDTWTSDETDETSAVIIDAGANITIPAGTTVEAYSVNVPTGTTLNVENGATLIVGAGGVTTATGEEAISINIGSNDGSGAIKISPDAPAAKAQPRVRIKLTTIAHQDAQGNSHWQYFARPTGMTPKSFTVVEAAGADKHYIRGYIGSTDSYENITGPGQFENYEGYAITNNSSTGGVVYQFEGELNANQNAKIKFKNNGFSLMGNSYLAPVSVEGLFKGIIEGVTAPEAPATAPVAFKAPMEDGGNAVEWTIWIYNCANERFEQTNLLQAKAKKKQLQPMQGFFMKLREGSSLNAAIDYVGAVWNNDAKAGPILAPARNENGMGIASIIISANGCADQIDLFEDAEFDNSFNNGADASKLMNLQGMFNLYAQTEAGTLSCVASDNIEGTILTFQANNASEYELSFNGVENMNYSLIDLSNSEIVEMSEGNVYHFNAIPNSTEARFQIVTTAKAPTAMDKVVNTKAAKGIYSITGAYLGEAKNFSALPQGVYVVNGEKIVK